MTPESFLQYLVRLMIIFLIMPVHEFAHAWAANKLGDDTSKYKGRLTLSPFAHIDIFGAIMLFFFGFGWAKPVPVNISRFKKPRLGMLLTALAGPVSNLIIAFLGMIALKIFAVYGAAQGTLYYIQLMLTYFISVNVSLAVFNLLPIPPLDGSRILSYFTPYKVDKWLYENQMVFYIIVLVLMSTGILSYPLSLLAGFVVNGMDLLTAWIPMLLR